MTTSRRHIAISTALALLTSLLGATGTVAVHASSEAAPPPLLSALAYVPLDAEGLSVDFIDWAALMARHGGSAITSDGSSIGGREALIERIGAAEPIPEISLTDALHLWRGYWGWDVTDLEWQLHIGSSTSVLRFGEYWDRERFIDRLEGRGYELDETDGFETYRLGEAMRVFDSTELERVSEVLPAGPVDGPRASVTLPADPRTIIIDRGGAGPRLAEGAATVDPASVADSPFGRVAQGLDDASVAMIRSGDLGCRPDGRSNGLLRGDAVSVVRSAGRLKPYQAYGAGHARDDTGESQGRYVFAYDSPRRAQGDLEGRRSLLTDGVTADGRKNYRDHAFRLEDAVVAGQQQVFEVSPYEDAPGRLFEAIDVDASVLAACGNLPAPGSLARHRPHELPVFAGPATLTVSGGPGIHSWEEIRFGADEVRVRSVASADAAPCSTRVRLDDRDGRVATGNYAAPSRRTSKERDKLRVEYATAGMRVDSTCASWSLRFEPVKDPDLEYTIKQKRYPVRGSTVAELLRQTDHIDGEYAGQARNRTIWRFWWQEGLSSCDVTHGDAKLRSIIVLPKWKRPTGVDSGVVRAWQRSWDAMYRHELAHVTVSLQGVHAIDERLDEGLSAETCKGVKRKANKAADRLFQRYRKVNKRFDKLTDHGIKQGTQLH